MPQRTRIMIGPVSADVQLSKTSGPVRDAQYETRRVQVAPPRDGAVDLRGALESGAVTMDTEDAKHDAAYVLSGGASNAEPAVSIGGAADGFVEVRQAGDGPVLEVGLPEGDPLADPFGDLADPAPPLPGDDGFAPLPGQGSSAAADHAAVPETRVERGVTGPDGWVDLTDRLAAIDESCKLDGLRIDATVARSAVPRERIRDSHYVAPAGRGAPKVLALLWHGLREEKSAAVVRWTKRTNQALGVLVPAGSQMRPHLLLLELEWAGAMRPVPRNADLSGADTTQEERDAALDFVEALYERAAVFGELADERAARRAELLEAARDGRRLPNWSAAAPPQELVDFAALLGAR